MKKRLTIILVLLYVTTLTLLSACSTANGKTLDEQDVEATTYQPTTVESTTAIQTTVEETTEPTTVELTTAIQTTIEETTEPSTIVFSSSTQTESSNNYTEKPENNNNDSDESSYYDPVNDKKIIHKEISSRSIPLYKDTEIVAYITYGRLGLYDSPIVFGDKQWIVDEYDICMYEYTWDPYYFGHQPTVLLGHNYKSFAGLPNCCEGDKVFICTSYGAEYLYEISSKQIVVCKDGYTFADPDTGVEVMESRSNHGVLQFVTCVEGYSSKYRWLVKAELIDGTIVKENSE